MTCRHCGRSRPKHYFGTGPGADLCHDCHQALRIEQTQAGPQTIIPDTPQRKVPETGLKPKRKQTEKPTLLEMYEEVLKQPKLF